jgi:hypothetical protein
VTCQRAADGRAADRCEPVIPVAGRAGEVLPWQGFFARSPASPPPAAFAAAGALCPSPARAIETDQYTPPPVPLADIGPHVQQKLRATIQEVVSQTNVAYLEHRREAKAAWLPFAGDRHRAEADRLQTDEAVAAGIRAALGEGVAETSVELWVKASRFPHGEHQFAPPLGQSIYGANPFGKPPTLVLLSPTVRLFGVYAGADKVGHFVQQGHQYFEAYRAAERAGGSPADCLRKAVAVGVFQEETYFGLLTVGVYSNADLASNYAGLKFYLNLTRPVVVNGRRLPPILRKRQELWEINPDLPADFLRPYVSDHWNEAVNPNLYTGVLLDTVRARFPERAAGWAAYFGTDPSTGPARAAALATFYGEPYGHSGTRRLWTVAHLAPPGAGPVQHAAVVAPAKR